MPSKQPNTSHEGPTGDLAGLNSSCRIDRREFFNSLGSRVLDVGTTGGAALSLLPMVGATTLITGIGLQDEVTRSIPLRDIDTINSRAVILLFLSLTVEVFVFSESITRIISMSALKRSSSRKLKPLTSCSTS